MTTNTQPHTIETSAFFIADLLLNELMSEPDTSKQVYKAILALTSEMDQEIVNRMLTKAIKRYQATQRNRRTVQSSNAHLMVIRGIQDQAY